MRVLFTTVYDPAPLLNRWAATDQMAYRLTRGQGIFTMNEHAHAWPLHLLAQNIDCPSTVLEWPSLEKFEQECASGGYDYICISFMNREMNKLAQMSDSVRRLSPFSKIVVGGYGVICLPDDQEAETCRHYDHICRGEGVRFLRKLLGRPVQVPVSSLLPQSGATLPWLGARNRGTVGALLAALGCTQKCPFCVTSFYAQGGLIPVMSERQLYEGMLAYWRVNPFTRSVNIYDENFLDYEDRVRRLGRFIQNDSEFGLCQLNYFTFGSISALCKYDPDELLLNGLDTVWIGIESLYTSLRKRQGQEPADVFRSLHEVGIKTIGSMILGLDIQNGENIVADEDYFVELNPTFQQISILTVEPHTPIARVYQKQNARKYPWENYHLYGQTYEPRNFTFDQLLSRVDQLYRRLYRENGPSITRALRCNLNGYRYCSRSRNPLLHNAKAMFFLRRIKSYAPLLRACIEFAPTDRVRENLCNLEKEITGVIGPLSATRKAYSNQVVRRAERQFRQQGEGDPPLRKDDFRRYKYLEAARRPKVAKPYEVEYPEFQTALAVAEGRL
jgi:radical SAM superfamily enzyme YgiQ (UPF0313 family)